MVKVPLTVGSGAALKVMQLLRGEGGEAVFEVQSGVYRFTADINPKR